MPRFAFKFFFIIIILFCASLVWASGLKDLYLAYRGFSLSNIWVWIVRQEIWIGDQETDGWEDWEGKNERVSKQESKSGMRRGEEDVILTSWSLGSMPCHQCPLPSFLPSISPWSYKQDTNLKLPPHHIPQRPLPLQVLPENIDLMVYFFQYTIINRRSGGKKPNSQINSGGVGRTRWWDWEQEQIQALWDCKL